MTNQDDDYRRQIDQLEQRIDHLENDKRVLEKLLVKYAGKGALAEACKQIPKFDRDAANLRFELIDQHVTMAREGGCSRSDAIRYAMERFKVGRSTVENALDYMEQKRGAEIAHTPTLFTMNSEAEAKAEAFRANESEIKAQAKQRFE